MNLMEENLKTKKEKDNNISKIILILIILLVIAIIFLGIFLMYVQNNTINLFLNGQLNENLKELLIIEEDGTIYVPIKEVANYFGYDSYNGEYSDKSEDKSKCYVQSRENKEVANFTLNSNKVYKLDLTDISDNYEYIYSQEPVKLNGGVLYATSEMIEKAFNVSFEYDKDKKTIAIFTMPYLIQYYSDIVLNYGYTKISDVFSNQKTILDNILIVEKEDKYAVIDIQGNSILEAKYDNITYLPNVGDFLVESDGKVGIISKDSETKVPIIYDSIKLMDSDLELYVVKKDNKYGVIDFNGNLKIYIENDEIGMDISEYEKNNIKNKYILIENLIPAKKDDLWGIYDTKGNVVVDFKYDSFGCVTSNVKNGFNLLVISDYNVIVACKDGKYTLLTSEGEELFAAPVADDIYMTISGNVKNYYISADNKIIDMREYFDKIGVKPIKSSESTTNSSNTSNDSVNLEGNTTNKKSE